MICTINLFTKAVPDTPTSWLDKFSSVWLAQAINYDSIDGMSGNGTPKAIRGYDRVRGLAEDGKIGQQLAALSNMLVKPTISNCGYEADLVASANNQFKKSPVLKSGAAFL